MARTGGMDQHRHVRTDLDLLSIEGNGWGASWAALFFAADDWRFVTGQPLIVDACVISVLRMMQALCTRESSGPWANRLGRCRRLGPSPAPGARVQSQPRGRAGIHEPDDVFAGVK